MTTEYDKNVHSGVRLYSSNGKHVASILPCSDKCADLALPNGTVLYCGIDYELLDVLQNLLPKIDD